MGRVQVQSGSLLQHFLNYFQMGVPCPGFQSHSGTHKKHSNIQQCVISQNEVKCISKTDFDPVCTSVRPVAVGSLENPLKLFIHTKEFYCSIEGKQSFRIPNARFTHFRPSLKDRFNLLSSQVYLPSQCHGPFFCEPIFGQVSNFSSMLNFNPRRFPK